MTTSDFEKIRQMKVNKEIKNLIYILRWCNDPQLQSAAGEALVDVGEISDLGDVETLVIALNDRDADVREIVKVAFHQVNDPRAVEPLVHVIRDINQFWFLRWRAASRLGEIRDRRAVEALIDVLKGEDQADDTDSDVRRHAAGALASIGDVRAVGPLINALRDPKALMRWDASEALIRMDAIAVESLITAFKERQVLHRAVSFGQRGSGQHKIEEVTTGRDIARILGRIGDARAVLPLIEALNDPLQEVRQEAARALVSIYRKGQLDEAQKAIIVRHKEAISRAGGPSEF